MAAIRRATQTECPLGEAGFVEQSEAKFQVQLRPLPPGPVARMGGQGERGLVESAGQAATGRPPLTPCACPGMALFPTPDIRGKSRMR